MSKVTAAGGESVPRDGAGRFRTAAVGLLLLAAGWLFLPGPVRAEACRRCHDKKTIGAGERSIHPPFEGNECTACHGDHGAQNSLVLVAVGNKLCDNCHNTGVVRFLRAHRNVRGPGVTCISCHDPHRSTEDRLLRRRRHRPLAFGRCDPCHRYDGKLLKPVRDLCRGCHGGEEFTRRIVHAPVGRGECLSCHDPHASRQPYLLKARYAPDRLIKSEQDVALCLGCHERRNFFTESTDGTLFRSGSRNYHALHLAGAGTPGGRSGKAPQPLSCRNCHAVHTSEDWRLMRRELDCDGVPCLKLEYRRTDGGGQCLSGCHVSQTYSIRGGGAPVVAAVQAPAAAAARNLALLPEPTALEQSINRRCVGCHEKDVKRFAGGRIHAPVRSGFCSACHLDHGPENRLILLGREDRICARCHNLREAAATAAHGGFALEGSRCTECHDPHGGEAVGFVYARRHPLFAKGACGACHGAPANGWRVAGGPSEACRRCHDKIGREQYPHTAVAAKGCLGCHRAHAAREAALLPAPSPALCFNCHQRKNFDRETVHDPVRDGDCAACHPAHGAQHPRLLSRPFPLEQYKSFKSEQFGLCWECHDEASLTDPARGEDTGFRDGERNLHALHLLDRVSKTELGPRVQPGITCRNCHDPHATEAPRLIRRVLDCNGVPCLQVEFKKIGAGGKCLGGCHLTQSYLP